MRRNPVLSETEAFRLTVVGVGFAVLATLIGWATDVGIGVAVFVVLTSLSAALYLRRPEPNRRLPLRKAVQESHPHGALPGTRHVLVVANEPLAGEELSAHLHALGDGNVEVDVLAPVLSSRTHLAYTDIDAELREARERLSRSLAWATSHGFPVRGEVGDPSSPTTAIEDELRDFGADEVIVTTRRSSPSRWEEKAELERLRTELDVPVVQVAVDEPPD